MPWNDFSYTIRTLRKSPVFAITAILTIALGIGACTAIFSVADAVLLRPLPYKDPNRLVFACHDMKVRNVTDFPFTVADYIDLRDGAKSQFEDIAGFFTFRNIAQKQDGSPEQLHMAIVTPNFFRLLGQSVAFGRDFTDADGQPPPAPQPGQPVQAAQRIPGFAILSYEYWQRRYGGDTSIIEKGFTGFPGSPLIVGVLAPGFELLVPPHWNQERQPDIFLASRLVYDGANRTNVSQLLIGRLRGGATVEQAQTAADLVAAGARRNFPIHNTSGYAIRIEPMHGYLVAQVRPAILALMSAVVFLLLIASANVANLMLVRASLRSRELAVRTALGGNWWRLVRQMLTEAVLIAGAGAILGIGLAWAGIRELISIAPANIPRLDTIRIDPGVLAFAVFAALIAAALFGLPPAIRAARPDIMQVLRGSGRTAGLAGGGFLRSAVVIAEVALSFILLIGSGLMIRSFVALENVDPGFNPHGVLTFLLLGNRGGTAPEARAALMREIQTRLAALPGIEKASGSNLIPLTGGYNPIRWGTEQALVDQSKFQAANFQIVLPGYFEAIRARLIAGRTFTEENNATDGKLVVIDDLLAKKAFGNESAIGKRILARIRTPDPEWFEVIGVVAHQHQESLVETGREQIYVPDAYMMHGAINRWVLRTSGDPAKYIGPVRAEMARIDAHSLILEMQPMQAIVDHAQSGTRFELVLIGIFAVIAALLAAVGLYGVLSTAVRQRTSEIGVRMALGAAPSRIFSLFVTHGLELSAAGVGVGLLAASALTRLMSSMLIGVQATDPLTFIAMAFLFFVIAAIASWVPARRAAKLDPTVALREE